jgi:hypothetical protein
MDSDEWKPTAEDAAGAIQSLYHIAKHAVMAASNRLASRTGWLAEQYADSCNRIEDNAADVDSLWERAGFDLRRTGVAAGGKCGHFEALRFCRDVRGAFLSVIYEYPDDLESSVSPESVEEHLTSFQSELAKIARPDFEDIEDAMRFELQEILEPRPAGEEKQPDRPDSHKKVSQDFPQNPDIRDLCLLLAKELPKGRKKIEIAMEFASVSKREAENMLRQCNRFPHLWKAENP